MVRSSMHGQYSPFHMQRLNFQVQRLNFQMQKPQPQAHRASVQQSSHHNIQQGPRPTAPTSQNAPAQGSHNGRAYFKCGLTGHFAWQCPTRQAVPGGRDQDKPQGQHNLMYGKVKHMTSGEAQQAQDVVLGMFIASSHPTTVLFDSGASHSFITLSFVAKHNLPIANMKHTMLVSSPGGEMRTKLICLAVSISIRGGGGRLSLKPYPFRLQGHRHHTWHGLVKQV
jgi:hypothetical protein